MTSRFKRVFSYLLAPLAILFSSGCSLVGISNVEEARYTVVVKQDNFELRDYAPMVVVETTIDSDFEDAGDKAFRPLFNYISGNNAGNLEIAMTAPVIADQDTESGQKIAMTAPVIAESDKQGWHYRFVLPAEFTIDNAPKPLDERVRLLEIPGSKVAVIRYSGFWSEDGMREKTAELERWIQEQSLTPASQPRWAAYNPPWTLPFMRRNEVLVDVIPTN